MSTPRDLIALAMSALTLKAAGDSVDPTDEADALVILNMMLGTWGNKRNRILSSVKESFSLVIGQASYTIGTGGDFSTERPVKIETAYIQDSDGKDWPIKVIEDRAEYESIVDKDIDARPYKLYFERTFTSSRGTILLNRAPTDADTIYLVMWKPFTTFTSVTDTVVLPNGYEEAIYSQLAIRLAGHWGKEVPESTAAVAADSIAAIEQVNLEVKLLVPDCTDGIEQGNYSSITDAKSGD